MKITEIQVTPNFPIAPPPTRMKGSAIKSSNLAKPIYPTHSEEFLSHNNLAIIQQKKDNCSPGHAAGFINSTEMTPPKSQVKKEQKMAKTISVIVDQRRHYACLSARSGTPTMAKQFSHTPSQKECKTIEDTARVVKTVERYTNAEAEDEAENRLTLSHFQAKARSARPSKTRVAKTQEEMLNLKLEGTNYKITTKCTHSDQKAVKTLDRSELFEKRSHIYLTQQHPEVTQILKLDTNEGPNVQQFKQIISKIHVETEKSVIHPQSQPKLLKIRHRKMNIRSASAPSSKRVAKPAETARQHAKVNVINILEQHQISNKRSCHQVFTKYFKTSEDHQRTAKQLKPPMAECFVKVQLIEELREIQKQIKSRRNAAQKCARIEEKRQKYTTNFIEQKLKKRKSLIQHYTFKKVVTEKTKPQAVVVEDFHVDGWQMDHREVTTS